MSRAGGISGLLGDGQRPLEGRTQEFGIQRNLRRRDVTVKYKGTHLFSALPIGADGVLAGTRAPQISVCAPTKALLAPETLAPETQPFRQWSSPPYLWEALGAHLAKHTEWPTQRIHPHSHRHAWRTHLRGLTASCRMNCCRCTREDRHSHQATGLEIGERANNLMIVKPAQEGEKKREREHHPQRARSQTSGKLSRKTKTWNPTNHTHGVRVDETECRNVEEELPRRAPCSCAAHMIGTRSRREFKCNFIAWRKKSAPQHLCLKRPEPDQGSVG